MVSIVYTKLKKKHTHAPITILTICSCS